MVEVDTQSKKQWFVKMQRLVKVFILRNSVVSTPEVGMEHVNKCWKAYPVGNKGKSPESEHEEAKC